MESHPGCPVPAAICRAASASPPVIGPPDLSFSSADRADHTAAPIASLITGMRGRRRRHVSVDARTRSVGFSDEAVQSGVDAAVTAKTGEGVTVDASDQELQQYLFDLQGYFVIPNRLGAAEVAELNRLIDAQPPPSPRQRTRLCS